MRYFSTRGGDSVSATAAILRGLCPRGGLYVPAAFPAVNLSALAALTEDYPALAAAILHPYIPAIPKERLTALARRAYAHFDAPEVVPLRTLQSGQSVLELWQGPTMAFKDIALQILPLLINEARRIEGETRKTYVLAATSGDTGKAALEGFRDVPDTRVLAFYPLEGVSRAQKLQMTTQEGGNVDVCALRGSFDDAQTAVKDAFGNAALCRKIEQSGYTLSSANSINIGRVLPQIVYYFSAYLRLVQDGTLRMGEPLNFCVPTGNFGDILAGYYAKRMGLPVGKLICATNRNDVLDECIRTGRYDLSSRALRPSMSCSMDILLSGNLERLLFELCARRHLKVTQRIKRLRESGRYELDDAMLHALQADFWSGSCNEAETLAAIADAQKRYGYLMDPHTAVGHKVCCDYQSQTGDTTHTILLSTACPYKFSSAVLSALEPETVSADDFHNARRLAQISGTELPEKFARLERLPVLHNDVIETNEVAARVFAPVQDEYASAPKEPKKRGARAFLLPFILCLLTAMLTACVTALLMIKKFETLAPLVEAQDILRAESFYYQEGVAEEQWMTGALRGIAYSIEGDSYSEYFTREEYTELQQIESGNYIGVGILVGVGGLGGFYIEDVFDNTPAMDVGLQIGDRIIEINGVSDEGHDLNSFLDVLYHEVGDTNIMTVEREGEIITYTVQMREVYRPLVRYRMIEEGIGYIQLLAFHGDDVQEMRAALEALTEQGMTRLVLDLRDNLGGMLHDCVEISGLFLPKGKVVTTLRDREGTEVETHTTRLNGRDIPVALLVNDYSASASELFAGALRDHGVAKLFGTNTYGKGIVQSFRTLQGGGILKFTTHAYYTPNGICIQDTGLAPDVYIELPAQWRDRNVSLIPPGEDTQLEAALAYLREQ
ncbi:MAG: threonine synthase [Clostridiales bacterium]|nr:threonine synthase [Clostridiales bacterium]